MDTNKTPPERLAEKKKPRLTAMERLAIETGLDAGKTPYAILPFSSRALFCVRVTVCDGGEIDEMARLGIE